MAPATRQDVQGVINYAKDSIIQRMISRNDMQSVVQQIKGSILSDLNSLHAANQATIRQSQQQGEMLTSRMASLEHQLQALQQTMGRILEQQTRAMNALNVFGRNS